MTPRVWWLLLFASFALFIAETSGVTEHPLVIVSLDAFRWDYCDLHPAETPHLRALRSSGAYAKKLISVFPSNTFPNHYTIATGLWPAHHGIINNSMFDPRFGAFFRSNVSSIVQQSIWWGGEPIWVTAKKQGVRSACSFWVGSEAEIKGARPDWWKPYNYSIPFEARLNELIGWLTLPNGEGPKVVAFYLEETNSVGHAFGPDAPETAAAIQLLDTRVGAILARLQKAGIVANLVVVSDHGMTEVRPARCVALDDYLDLTAVQIDFAGPVTGLRPLRGTVDEAMKKLQNLPAGAKAFRAEDLPERFHLHGNPRIPPIWVLAGEGGWVAPRQAIANWVAKTRGEHGYDPEIPTMGGLLIVNGPAFVHDGRKIPALENVNLYNLFCAAAHLAPAINDGDPKLIQPLLSGR